MKLRIQFLKKEIQDVKTDLGKEIQLIRNELGNETLAVKTRLRKESDEIQAQILTLSNFIVGKIDEVNETISEISVRQKGFEKSLETLFNEQKEVLEEKFASLNATIFINRDNLPSKADSQGSENRNSSTVNNTLFPTASVTKPRDKEWITIQRRGTPWLEGRAREKFQNRTWTEYENGFGAQDADFWIGLQKMHNLTEAGFRELRVDLEDWEGNTAYASYRLFKVAGSADNYRLTVSGYSGTARDALSYSNGAIFSTLERDNDKFMGVNCALSNGGPWWHKACSLSSLN